MTEPHERNALPEALQAKFEQVLSGPVGETMKDCIKRVWGVGSGDTERYRRAKAEYMQIEEIIRALARRGRSSSPPPQRES